MIPYFPSLDFILFGEETCVGMGYLDLSSWFWWTEGLRILEVMLMIEDRRVVKGRGTGGA